jgi:hypothetical protein
MEKELKSAKRTNVETENSDYEAKLTKLTYRKHSHKKLSAAALQRVEELIEELEVERKSRLSKEN